MENKQIIKKWLKAEPYSSSKNNLKTDGQFLWSYDLPIARYGWSDDTAIIYNYNVNLGGRFISNTTSKHITLVLRTCEDEGVETTLVRSDYHG